MLSGFSFSVVGFLLAIAILVAVHEYGHFWVARKLGVKVLKFSIGFGKSLFTWRRPNDPAEYSIGMIPLGGYVQMLDEREGQVAEAERHLAFNNQSLWVRTAVVFAGPGFNFIFAILAIWLVFIIGSADVTPFVGHVKENSLAQQVGFKVGDQLLTVDDREIKTWGDQQFYIMHQAMKGNAVNLSVAGTDGAKRDIDLDFATVNQRQIVRGLITSQIGLYPTQRPAEVGEVVEGFPAAEAGLLAGDKITAIDGELVEFWSDIVLKISSKPGQTLSLTIDRDGTELTQSITTKVIIHEEKEYGQIGIRPPAITNDVLRYGPIEGVTAAIDYSWRMTNITFRSLWRMLTARMSIENISGPITIARVAGETVQHGFVDFVRLLAIISISLGLLNLLPIPILDGGHLLYFLIEAVTGKEPSESIMLWGQKIGIFLLIILMSIAFYNDIMRLLGLM